MQLIIRPSPTTVGDAAAPDSVEVVERKGLGHPDTICDELAERFSAALSRFFVA